MAKYKYDEMYSGMENRTSRPQRRQKKQQVLTQSFVPECLQQKKRSKAFAQKRKRG
jgi:hypothetical protein